MEVFIGTIMPFGFNFAPIYWSTCQGQTISINQNAAMYSLLGVTFGGNGTTTFQLPNLQGRIPLGVGRGPMGVVNAGEVGGAPSVTLTQSNLPSASVSMQVSGNNTGNQSAPSPEYPYVAASPAAGPGSALIWSSTMSNPQSVQGLSLQGGNQPVSVMNPYLALNFCIAMQGIFPSRQ